MRDGNPIPPRRQARADHRGKPRHQPASVEEGAASIMDLCSPAAGMVTGTHLLVDGGWTVP